MHEIEAKIHLNKKEFDQLKQELNQTKGVIYRGQFKKEDTYYEHPIPHLTLRLRKINEKTEFQIKYRSLKKGVEVNKEWEWPLKNPSVFKLILKKLNLKPYIKKNKQTDLFIWKKMNIELNYVKHLGHFLEIEKLIKNEKDCQKALQELKNMFKALGFSKRAYEKKPYLELLQTQSR